MTDTRRAELLSELDELIYAVKVGASYGSERNAVLAIYDREVQGAATELAACVQHVKELREREAATAVQGGEWMPDANAMWTPEEAGKLLANRVMQPHYVEWVIRKCIKRAMEAPSGILKDAKRYRWLRDKATAELYVQENRVGSGLWYCHGTNLDEEIDKRIAAATARKASE